MISKSSLKVRIVNPVKDWSSKIPQKEIPREKSRNTPGLRKLQNMEALVEFLIDQKHIKNEKDIEFRFLTPEFLDKCLESLDSVPDIKTRIRKATSLIFLPLYEYLLFKDELGLPNFGVIYIGNQIVMINKKYNTTCFTTPLSKLLKLIKNSDTKAEKHNRIREFLIPVILGIIDNCQEEFDEFF